MQAQALAAELEIDCCIETSAKSGLNVDECFTELITTIYDKTLKGVSVEVMATTTTIRVDASNTAKKGKKACC
jgi:GTPase SAR1 family protein